MKLSDLLAKLGITDTSAAAEVEGFITSAVTEKTGKSIPKSRLDEVIAQRNDANAKVSELEAVAVSDKVAIEKHTARIAELEPLKSRLDEINAREEKSARTKWAEKSKVFAVAEGDARKARVDKAKASGRFTFAEGDTELTAEQVKANLAAYDVYEDAEYFGTAAADGSGTAAPIPKKVEEKGRADGLNPAIAKTFGLTE